MTSTQTSHGKEDSLAREREEETKDSLDEGGDSKAPDDRTSSDATTTEAQTDSSAVSTVSWAGIPHSECRGTGTLHVRSSGFHADGGDFDACSAGAGREAYRLLKQKGISFGRKPSSEIVMPKTLTEKLRAKLRREAK